jgi:hypothetical protein
LQRLHSSNVNDIPNANFVIPVLDATNESQYNISGEGILGNNTSLCQVTGNRYIMGNSNNNIQV